MSLVPPRDPKAEMKRHLINSIERIFNAKGHMTDFYKEYVLNCFNHACKLTQKQIDGYTIPRDIYGEVIMLREIDPETFGKTTAFTDDIKSQKKLYDVVLRKLKGSEGPKPDKPWEDIIKDAKKELGKDCTIDQLLVYLEANYHSPDLKNSVWYKSL